MTKDECNAADRRFPTASEAVEKCLDTGVRNPEECGVLVQYAAMKKDECNAADRRFPTASQATLIIFSFHLNIQY
jgi:hypothetical protein